MSRVLSSTTLSKFSLQLYVRKYSWDDLGRPELKRREQQQHKATMYCEQLDKADTSTEDTMMMNGNDYLIGVFSVPTKGSKEAEESSQKKVIVDTTHLTAQDLKILKKQDPFLYYSLPSSVRRNAATADGAGRNKDMDYMSSPLTIGKSSTPTPTTKSTSTKVERRSCISFECHTDVVLEDEWLNDDADAAVNEGFFEVDVDFDSMLGQLLRDLNLKQ